MKYTFQYKISSTDIEQISKNKFALPKVIFDFIPKSKETLLKILIPTFSANIYSLIQNQNLILDEKLFAFFNSLSKQETIFVAVFTKYNSENDMSFEIHFSKVLDFSDLAIETNPILSNNVLSIVKQLEPLS